jgi:hypothetical protein
LEELGLLLAIWSQQPGNFWTCAHPGIRRLAPSRGDIDAQLVRKKVTRAILPRLVHVRWRLSGIALLIVRIDAIFPSPD